MRFQTNGLDVHAYAWGDDAAPLALCLHGYPDTAWTWRHLGPRLAGEGWRVVAPFLRGYAPTSLAPDGCYQLGALARDAAAAHRALGGDERAVIIGHDWGAAIAYVTAAAHPELFARIVTLAIAPPAVVFAPLRQPRRLVTDRRLLAKQLPMSWYMLFQQLPWLPERVLEPLVTKLWRDWSPGYDGREDVARALEALRPPGHATAAMRYYRALAQPWARSRAYATEQRHFFDVPCAPTLYLHGADDGCQTAAGAPRAIDVLASGSRVEVVPGTGHFLQLEAPELVNGLIADFVAGRS